MTHVELLQRLLEWAQAQEKPLAGWHLRGALERVSGECSKAWFEAYLLLRDVEAKRYGPSWFDGFSQLKPPDQVVAFVETALRVDEEKRARRLQYLKEQDEKACGGLPF